MTLVRGLWRALTEIDRLIRIHFLGASILISLLGAASVSPRLDGRVLAGLLAVTLCFHIFSYVLNDVVDLPVDRTQPSRSRDPLVRGAVRAWQALVLALLQVPVALAITRWLGGGAIAYAALGCAFALMTAYNLWGKRCAVPPVTDGVQGLAWGGLALYGAAVAGSPTVLTLVVAGYMAGYVFLINGIHGGLRDLDNDLRCARRTTAIFLGAQPLPDGTAAVPTAVRFFSYAVQVALVMVIALPLFRNDFGYGPGAWTVSAVTTAGWCAMNILFLGQVLKPETPRWNVAFRLHLLLLLVTPAVAFAPSLSGQIGFVLAATFFPPLVLFDTTRVVVARLWCGRRGSRVQMGAVMKAEER